MIAVSVSPNAAGVFLGATQQFTATVTGSANTTVTWTVDNIAGGNATVGTISAAGLFTAPVNLPNPVMVTVRATSVADATKSATAALTVQSDVAVAVMPAAPSVELGATQQFAAAVTGSGAPNPAVNWAVDGVAGGNAMTGTIDATGLYTAPMILPAPAAVNITATSVADASKSAGAAATVTSNLTVSLTGPASVNNGAMAQFIATVTPAPMSNPHLGVLWSVNGVAGGNAMFGTIDAGGLYTAPAVAPPSVTITATSIADASKADSIVLTINSIITVSISPAPAVAVPLEAMQVFTPTVSGTLNQNVTWDVNGILGGDQNTVGAITNPGSAAATYFAPVNMPAPGTVITVRATSQADPAKSASATVNLTSNIIVAAATASGAATSVRAVGRRETICAAIAGTSNPALVWSVNGIANGNATVGQIVAPPAPAPTCPLLGPLGALGFAMDYVAPAAIPAANPVTVTAASAADPAKSSGVQVTIVAAVTVSVAPASLTLFPGGSQQFAATVSGSPNTAVAWSVSGTGCMGMPCGTVSVDGLYTASPTAAPMAVDSVTATSVDGGAAATATVTISTTAPVISGLAPASVSAGAGSPFLLRVTGANFGAGAEILFGGVARTTSCASASECTATVAPADVAAAGSINIQIRLAGPPLELSNAAALEVVTPVAAEEVIALTVAAPEAADKDIAVVDIVPVPGVTNNFGLLGVVAGNSCIAGNGPVAITRPAAGAAQVSVCLGGADAMQSFTLSGPTPPDITIFGVQPLALGFVQVEVILTVPSTAQPGLRTLFAVDGNKNKTAASGAILVQ